MPFFPLTFRLSGILSDCQESTNERFSSVPDSLTVFLTGIPDSGGGIRIAIIVVRYYMVLRVLHYTGYLSSTQGVTKLHWVVSRGTTPSSRGINQGTSGAEVGNSGLLHRVLGVQHTVVGLVLVIRRVAEVLHRVPGVQHRVLV